MAIRTQANIALESVVSAVSQVMFVEQLLAAAFFSAEI
jgi:hypothetical protein